MGAICGGPGWRVLVQALPLLCLLQPLPGGTWNEELHANPVPFTSPAKVSHPPGALTFGEEAQVLENPPPLASWDQDIVKATSRAPLSAASRRSQAAPDPGDHADRDSWGPSITITSFWNSSGPDPCRPRKCAVGPGSSVPCGLLQRSCPPAGPCRLRVRIPSCPSADDVASDVLPGTDVASTATSPGVPVRPAVSAPTSSPTAHPPTLPRSFLGHGGSTSWPRPPTRCHPGAVSMHSPPDTLDAADCGFPDMDARAPLSLGFRVWASPKAALCLRVDFGDSSGVQVTIYNVSRGIAVTAYHQFRKEGVYVLKALIYNDLCGPGRELGPYYVEMGPATVSVFMNSSSIRRDELLVFAGSHADQKSTVVTHHFVAGPPCNVSFTCQSCAAGGQAWPSVTVQYRMQPISVYTNGTVFATDVDITFLAVTEETTPLEFVWSFGEGPALRTTSRSIKRRLSIPQWYSVTVQAASGLGRVASEPRRVRTQRRIVANRLVSPPSALLNASVTFTCRLNFGTNVAFLWDFGDGTMGPGGSSAHHTYQREGQFTVQVRAFNDVSAVSLAKQLFVVREPCQPPPVKNMGPGKVQVWRSQPVTLGVTFESAILCDISQGLSYTWTIRTSEGWPVPLPPGVSTRRQTITVPSYFLELGNYTALARVQVDGSVVHSNYSVGVEVRARAPVSVISEGTHLFISRAPSVTVVLSGSQSYDPDNPRATLRYHWTCTAAGAPGEPCFTASSPHSLRAGAPSLSFPASSLSNSYDQFLVTLTVSSAGRNSSEAQVFLSPRPDVALRFVRISRGSFKDVLVNWNEELSLRAECDACAAGPRLSYSWDLFLVNATEGTRRDGPFCRAVGLLGAAGLGADSTLLPSSAPSTAPSCPEPCGTGVASSRKQSPQPWVQPGPSPSSGPVGTHPLPAAGNAAFPGLARQDAGSPGTWSLRSPSPSPSDFEADYGDIQEAVPPTGRQPAHWSGASLQGADPSLSPGGGQGDGDNLLGPLRPAARPALMVDWPKAPVGRALFRSYTASGITGHAVTIKPFSLSPGETYVVQASVASTRGLLGRAQLYVTLHPAPRDVACQVQPHRGLEAHTVFSVFCMAVRPDFRYKFSYRIGNASEHTLYHGRDTQYYFVLPAGEPSDNYKVMVSTEIMDGVGSRTLPCAVAVTVLPHFHGSLCLDEDTYNSSLKHLSTLQLMGSYTEIRNYITTITRVLSRWAVEDRSPSCGQWSRIQDALISSTCGLPVADQEDMTHSVLMLRGLLRFPRKLSFRSAALILKSARAPLAQSPLSGRLAVDKGLMLELILLISEVLDASDWERPRNSGFLQEEGTKIISDLLLDGLSASMEHQLHVSAGQMEFRTRLHHDLQSSVQSLGSVQVHLPADLAAQSPVGAVQGPCYISQLMLFKKNLYPWGRGPGQIGQVVSASLFGCSSRRPVGGWRLRAPVAVEFGEEGGLDNGRTRTAFVLLRDRVNVHEFTGAATPRESLHIRIEFFRPPSGAFPVMVLVRFSEKPTPSAFLVKKVYVWDEQPVHLHIPAGPLRDLSLGYLSLLDADYDRSPRNRYSAQAVNYTVRFHWLQCVAWEAGEWRPASSSPQPGASPGKVNCSHDRLVPVSISRRSPNATFSVSDISELQRHPENLLPGVLIVVFTILYALLVTKSRRADCHERKKAGYVFLHEDAPPGHQLYAVVVDTGFRSPTRCSAKVYIVLCGEHGLSGPRELYCPEQPLFERNSRHTFVLSVPALLGPLRRICLWHDSRGPTPAWYVSHVMVKELAAGPGHSWLFPAECWLSASGRDGHTAWELRSLRRGLGFWKLLYCKFTEYLEDFHVWVSVYSRPSPSGFPPTARLTVAFALLCAYACLTALVTAAGQEQLVWALSAPDAAAAGSLWTGLLGTLLASPGAQLLSLLFRLSQDPGGPSRVNACRSRSPLVGAAPGPNPRGGTAEAGKMSEGGLVSGSSGACRRAAGGDGAGCPPPEREDLGADAAQRAPREKGTRGAQAASSGFGGVAALRWPRALLPWSGSAAWVLCGMVSVACGLGTAFLGYRFDPTQCVRWLYLLAASVLCCVLVTQPLLVSLLALGFAWRRRHDPHFFTEALHAATKDLGPELEARARPHPPHRVSQTEEVLAARQRARHLRRARPPSAAQLSAVRQKLQRQTRTRWALRGASSASGGLGSVADWWGWTLTTLLDGLHGGGAPPADPPGAQPRALGGKCYLLGSLVIRQLRRPSGSAGQLPSRAPVLPEDLPPEVGGPDGAPVTEPATPGDSRGCRAREPWELSLGSTRPAAHAALSGLRAGGWIDGSTSAVSVHFVLYNCPTRLLSSVALHAELLPAGGLALAPLVESVVAFHSDSALWHRLALPELAFLVLSLTQSCLQLHRAAQEGVRSYWGEPGSWLELAIAGAGLARYAASCHLATVAGAVTDRLHRGHFRGSMDLSFAASWNQRVTWLQGTLSFLLTLKCIHLFSVQGTTASCSFLMRRSLAGAFAAALAGVLALAAHSHLRAVPPGTLTDFSRSPRSRLSRSDLQAPAWCCGALFMVMSTAWLGMLRGSFTTLARKRKSFQSQSVVRLADVTAYVRTEALAWLGLERPQQEETEMVESHNYYLDDVSDLLDELLSKIHALSDSLQLPLPKQQFCDMQEARAKGHSSAGISA
ncbi:Polycystic kidney disease protein 1-like 1 [Vulpes lagopus]